MSWLHPYVLFLLPLAPFTGWYWWRIQKRNARWRASLSLQPTRAATGVDLWLGPVSLAGVIICLVVALARPVWDPRPVVGTARGQDTVFLVDVSRSMLTVDVAGQSRIAAVCQALKDLQPELQNDRVALVAFAGTSVVKCPLTTDLGFFQQAVAGLDPRSTSRGGTLLGDALRQIKTLFVQPNRTLSVWVFTDGGDQESFPVEAAKELGQVGVHLQLWGVGSLQGGSVPEKGVTSQLNEELLQTIASAVPGGSWWGSKDPLWQLNAAYQQHRLVQNQISTNRMVYQEGAWWLLIPMGIFALIFLGKRPKS